MGELADLAGHLDAGRAGADDDERQPRRAPLRVGLELGGLESLEDPSAYLERAVERLDLERERAPLVVSEVGIAGPAGDHQEVVGDRPALCRGSRARRKLAPLQVEAFDLAHQHRHIAPAAEDLAQRGGDLARRQRAGRHLVAQRLEQVVVVTVDQRHIGVEASQPLDGEHPAEAAADHDHVRAPRRPLRSREHASIPGAQRADLAPLKRSAGAAGEDEVHDRDDPQGQAPEVDLADVGDVQTVEEPVGRPYREDDRDPAQVGPLGPVNVCLATRRCGVPWGRATGTGTASARCWSLRTA